MTREVNRPKLVFVNRFFHPDQSATAQILSDLAFSLAAAGQQVHVVTGRNAYDDSLPQYSRSEIVRGVFTHRVATSRFDDSTIGGRVLNFASFYVSAAWSLLILVQRGDIVVAKTDPPLISVVVALICRLKRAILVNWLQDLYPEIAIEYGLMTANSLQGRLLTTLRDASLRSARMTVAVGETMAERVIAAGIELSSVHVIPNWADEEAIHPIEEDANTLRRDWMLHGAFVVGYSGNLGRAHEWCTVVRAAELLRHRRDIRFLIIGGGHHRASVEGEVRRRGLTSFVFRPYQSRENLKLSLSAANVHWLSIRPQFDGLVIPSKFYAIAAAGRGIICITNPENEVAAIVRQHQCGDIVRPGEADQLAALLLQLADDRETVKAWGSNSRRMLEDNFARFDALAKWSNVFAGLRAGRILERTSRTSFYCL